MKLKLTKARVRDMKPGKNDLLVWDTRVPHFALRVRPNGTKRYMHIYTDPQTNKQKRTTIGDPQLITIENARSIAMQFNSGIKTEKAKRGDLKPLFADYANKVWFPYRKKFTKPLTQKRTRLSLDNQLLPNFGHLRLDEITKPMILQWFNRYSRDYPGGANRVLGTLMSIFMHAVKARVIENNAAHGITMNPARRMNRFLSDSERLRLLKALDNTGGSERYYCDAIKLLLLTGCRAGEIIGLRWSEVGEDDKLHLEDGKTGGRTVWLGEDALYLLRSLRGRRPHNAKFVFPHSGDKSQKNWDTALRYFWSDLRKKINLHDVRLHDLRHSFATQAARQGVAIPVISKLLGHRKIEMTMRYTHASNKDAEAAAERVGKMIAGMLGG